MKNSFAVGFQEWLLDIGSGVEETHFDRADTLLDAGEQVLDLALLARIDAERVDLAALRLQFVDQRVGFGGVAPRDADLVAADRKATSHRGADRVSRTDQQRDII